MSTGLLVGALLSLSRWNSLPFPLLITQLKRVRRPGLGAGLLLAVSSSSPVKWICPSSTSHGMRAAFLHSLRGAGPPWASLLSICFPGCTEVRGRKRKTQNPLAALVEGQWPSGLTVSRLQYVTMARHTILWHSKAVRAH